MQETSGRRTGQGIQTEFPWVMPMFGSQNPAMDSFMAWNQKYMATMNAMTQEWSRFVQARLREDMNFQSKLAACNSPEEAMRLTSEFWSTLLRDYQNETSALMRIGNGEIQTTQKASQ
jgi:hypothetical protein